MNGNGQFTAPTIGGNADNIGQDLNSVAPLATSWGGPSVGVDTMQVVRNASNTPQQNDLAKFGSFLGDIASETGHMAGQAAGWLASNVADMVTAPFRWGASLGNKAMDVSRINDINTASQQNDAQLQNVMAAFKSGQMSKQNYLKSLNDIAQTSDNLVRESTATNNKLNLDQQAATKAMIDTGSLVLTLMTTGFGKAGDLAFNIGENGLNTTATDTLANRAANWLTSKASEPFLNGTSDFISRVASQPEVFNSLTNEAKFALQRSTAEVLSQATNMTASQIGKATAVNVALKYPLTYGFLEPTATDFYNQLDNKKYGDAIQTLAFNALLLLSGGAIGQALKYGGKALGFISDRTFGQTSFWDELSKFYDQGQPNGFRDAAQKVADAIDNPQANKEFINSLSEKDKALFSSYDNGKAFLKDLSAVEATNMASSGNDAVAAAKRLATGQTVNENLDLSKMTHEQQLLNMGNFAQAQRLADQTAQELGLGRVAVGRVDARDLADISAVLSPLMDGGDKQAVLDAWDKLKADNSTRAYANNANFDTQVKSLIDEHMGNSSMFDQSVRDIKAQFRVRGFPESIGKQLTKMGYIPIKPVVNEAPFREGTGKLVSSFAQEGDLWTKAVKPLPVLENVGYMLTSIGMSPLNATQQVYQAYNDTLASMLQGSDAAKSITAKLDAAEAEKFAAKAAKSEAKTAAKAADTGYTKEELALMKKQGITPELLQKGKVSGGEDIKVAPESPTPKAEVAAAPHKATPQEVSDLMLKTFSDYAHNPSSGGIMIGNTRLRAPITDLRQLTTNDLIQAVDAKFGVRLSVSQAKEVAGALMDSMIQVPLEIRGLGGRIEDLNLKYNPTAKLLARTQGAGRFAWNPFFQMKLAYKTEALTQLEAGGKFPTILGTNKILSVIFPEHYAQLDEIRGTLRDAGIFDQASHTAVGGEGVNDITSASANLTHKLLPSQERSIAGLVATQADKVGMSPQQFIEQFPSQVRDTVQMIAQYDRNAQFLNSPMARTLNFAFFPFRFETKVATLTAKALAKTSPMTQFAVIKGFYNANQFLNSPQGQAWYSQNSDVIKLLQYFTPLSTLESVSNILGGKADSVGSFGELGGLPLGWIPQMLDAQGVSQQLFGHPITQSAYLDPKTGQEYQNYIPVTARGALLVAIQDFVGQLFTYPGAEAGLPSKTTIDRNIGLELTGANKKTDLAPAPLQPLTPQQKQFQQAIQGANGQTRPTAQQPGMPFTAPSISVPAQSTPLTDPRPLETPKLKKSQFKPAPLP